MTSGLVGGCLAALIAGLLLGRHDCPGESSGVAWVVMFLAAGAVIISRR